MERKYAKRLELPCLVDTDSAKANYKNGVLEVVLDRREKKGGKSIEID
ncbi:MAG: Hsp20 family protein [Methanomassiliicoccales archaeon]